VIAAPAVDLRGGRCVQLVGGRPEEERVSLPDPIAQARYWWDLGFCHLHVVDLDAALSLGENRGIIGEIVGATGAQVQVGGGVRTDADVGNILALGVCRVIVGTRAVDDPEWLEAMATAHPHRMIVAADIRDGFVLRRGWTESSGLPVQLVLDRLDPLPLAGVLCTDVSREGRMEGIDLPGAEAVIRGSRHPVWISGGITTMEEVRALDRAGAAGAVLGMAIYTGVLPPEQLAEEFGA
jgi:phosphoribosylformimino-5-aminoimidazole carboxamide ribotide isomerase